MKWLAKAEDVLLYALWLSALALIIASLTGHLPANLEGFAPLIILVASALAQKQRGDSPLGVLLILFASSVLLAGSIAVWSFEHLASPAREIGVTIGICALLGIIMAGAWWLQKRARSAQ